MDDLKWKQMSSNRDFIAESIYNLPNGISLQVANEMLVTFAFTRHPFRRLVSAYYSKFHRRMSRKPANFARYVIREILEHLENGTISNRHFMPQYLTCPYCQLQFDLVGQLEDMETDTEFLTRHLGLKVKYVTYYLYFYSI